MRMKSSFLLVFVSLNELKPLGTETLARVSREMCYIYSSVHVLSLIFFSPTALESLTFFLVEGSRNNFQSSYCNYI